jgi:hypothetical protein
MSCLFNSLGHLLEIPSNTMRQTICDYLAENKPIIEGMSTSDILSFEGANYICNMRQSHVWGGAIEIQVAVRIWNVRIIVQNHRDGSRPIEFIPPSPEYTRTLTIYWTGGHYEPVCSIDI